MPPVDIADDDLLYRRLAPHQVNKDGSVNSSAFKRSNRYETEVSVDVAKLTDPQTSANRAGRAGFQLGALTAGHARSLRFEVEHAPVPGNDSHGLIKGFNDQERSRALARGVQVVPDVSSQEA